MHVILPVEFSFFKHIGYVSANIGLFFIEEHSHLFCIQPHGLSFQLDIKLGLAILALVDDDFVVQVDLLHRFMGFCKPLFAKVIYLSLRLQDNARKYVGSIAISLAKMVYSKAKLLDFVLPFPSFFLHLPMLRICLLMDAYFRICNTLATCRRRCICLFIKAFRGGQVMTE